MRYLVVSNTISNGGDHLIAGCGIRMMERFAGKENFTFFNSYACSTENIDISLYDAMVYIGGPLYSDRLLNRNAFPLLYKMKEAGKRIFLFGCGWYGSNDSAEAVYGFAFQPEIKEILSYIDDTGILGCRDYLTQRILKNNGYQNVLMTGCPVWYRERRNDIPRNYEGEIKKIAISDLGMTKNSAFYDDKFQQFTAVADCVKQKFPKAEIIFTFNNGIRTKYSAAFNLRVAEFLDTQGIPFYDLSNGDENFRVYDDCDLHIGYRVHSHIYCLTQGIPSVLICEDARGIGMNKTLGLDVLKANASLEEEGYVNNPFLIRELSDAIDELAANRSYVCRKITELFSYYYDHGVGKFFEILKNPK